MTPLRWPWKKKDEGPFKANRILDTRELKIDQVYTREGEKAIALFTHVAEKTTQQVDVGGQVGPISAQVGYKAGTDSKLRAIYFQDNISEDELLKNKTALIATATEAGSAIPADVDLQKAKEGDKIPLTGSTILEVGKNGSVNLSGSFTLNSNVLNLPVCTNCGKGNPLNGSKHCNYCGKPFDTDYS